MKRWFRILLLCALVLAGCCGVSMMLAATVFCPATTQSILLEPLNVELSIEPDLFSETIPATFTIIEVCDFECRHSAAIRPALNRLREELGDSAIWATIPYPRGRYEAKQMYGKAYCAARRQHKANAFVDSVFSLKPWKRDRNDTDRTGWALATVFKAADACSLDLDMFEKDLRSEQIDDLYVRTLIALGQTRIRVTPTLFVNGYRIESALTYSAYRAALKKIGARKAWQ